MGAWGMGIFENDSACDFGGDVAEGGGLPMVERALDKILATKDEYLEAPAGQEGLAAADAIARLKGRGGMNTAYTELLDAWVEKSKVHPSEELIEKARLSIARILTEPSELLALWQDTEQLDAWKREVEDLSRRLGSDA